jgi:pSer/pThr/pTyr-binding forkhead associated (FHA) protein
MYNQSDLPDSVRMIEADLLPFLVDPSGQHHRLRDEVTHLGRAVENEIVITSRRASREHARVQRAGRRVTLEDLGSANGTFLNDERLLAPRELHDGDRITIGEVTLVFHDPDTTMRDSEAVELEVDTRAGLVRVNRRLINLSPKEFALLAYLYEHRNEVCSKDEIARAVWPEYQSDIYDYQIENLVRRLRSRLEPGAEQAQLLLTVRGQGYKLAAPA